MLNLFVRSGQDENKEESMSKNQNRHGCKAQIVIVQLTCTGSSRGFCRTLLGITYRDKT